MSVIALGLLNHSSFLPNLQNLGKQNVDNQKSRWQGMVEHFILANFGRRSFLTATPVNSNDQGKISQC
ncbi:MAG TPA: hypothetical protein VK641_04790 [Terriglobales bacterium]|nr:hypothetical protein [Terriglobales bacterium]